MDDVFDRQVINVNAGADIAKRNNIDWVIHIDRDELLVSHNDLKDELENSHADALRFEIMEAIPEKENYDHIFVPDVFKTKPNSKRFRLAKLLGCHRAFFDGEYFRGHSVSKMAYKLDSNISQIGVHGPKKCDGEIKIVSPNKIKLLHYDCIGIGDWTLKWTRRLEKGGAAVMRENRVRQMEAFEMASRSGKTQLSKLYKRIHFIPLYERFVLTTLGLLRKCQLDNSLFEILEGD